MDGKSARLTNLVLLLLAVVFTAALTFATAEAPRVFNRFIRENFDVLDLHPAIEPELIEQFMISSHVRLIGYSCLVVVGVLSAVGLLAEKRGLSSLGAIAFFLPTFGHFAGHMFFLAGLGMLRALWLPFWGPLLKLGDIALLPYVILVYPFALLGVDIRRGLAFLAIAAGLLVFLLGTLSWLYARFQKRGTADLWPYRFSRHPQYLGWMMWSYGLMLLAIQAPIPMGGQNPGASLPWLVSSLVIACVALGEEAGMRRERGEEYEAYRSRVPFLLPLPGLVTRLFSAPMRFVLMGDRPRRGRELVIVFLIYLAILVLLSLPFVLLNWPPDLGWSDWPPYWHLMPRVG